MHVLLGLLLSVSLYASEFIILGCREQTGLFSAFNDVLALLKCYEKGYYQGIEVDFGTRGVYYDEKNGPNWWSYYCEPICIGEKNRTHTVIGDPPFSLPSQSEKHTTRQEAFELIQKYIHFKPALQQKIDTLTQQLFANDYVIGVHYRGTDKIQEAPLVPYKKVAIEIINHLRSQRITNCKIFVATDEIKFLNYMKSVFGNSVCYQIEAQRSYKTPLHLSLETDHVKCGEEAIIDAVLLSRTQFLIRTSSNLSLWSTFFNPHLEVVELNLRY
jgi:hypothetical protein